VKRRRTANADAFELRFPDDPENGKNTATTLFSCEFVSSFSLNEPRRLRT